jgi:hypothetical protein
VLIIAEAMHESAPADVGSLIATLAAEVTQAWAVSPETMMLSPDRPDFVSRRFPR